MNCNLCNVCITSIPSFIFHLEYYHKLSNYECPNKECSRAFGRRDVFKKHLLSHVSNVDPCSSSLNDVNASNLETTEESLSTDIENDHHNSRIENENNIDQYVLLEQFKLSLAQAVQSIICKLYQHSSIPRSTINIIIGYFSDFLNSYLFESITTYVTTFCKDENLISVISLLTTCFNEVKSEYKRFQFLTKSKEFTKPINCVIGNVPEAQMENMNSKLILKNRSICSIPMSYTLKQFLQLPNTLGTILDYQKRLCSLSYLNYSNFVQCQLWNSVNTSNDNVIPIFLYFDDFEICNPLGSHASTYKLGAIYYSIPTIPPQYINKLKNIFTAMLFHSSDRTEFGNEVLFAPLINEIKTLEEQGLTITIGDDEVKVYFRVTLLLGDNLGMNSILGFNESFAAKYYCRLCIGESAILKTEFYENSNLIRNSSDYDEHVLNKLYGIKENCTFNQFKSFHVYKNFSCDLMHDLFEGVHRYVMAEIIKYFVNDKYFTLTKLNFRIKYFNYDTHVKNIPPPIKLEHLRNGCIIMSAFEMLTLVRNFRFIIGDLVPQESNVWQFYLKNLQITEILTSTSFSDNLCTLLTTLIAEHNLLYTDLFNQSLKPKFHFLTHYPRVIKFCGPPQLYSSMRFEGKHKELKTISKSISSRINTPFSILMRIQLNFMYRIITQDGFVDSIKQGPRYHTEIDFESFNLSDDLVKNLYTVKYLEINNIRYNKEHVLCKFSEENDLPTFYVINHILFSNKTDSNECNNIFFVCTMLETLCLSSHFQAYEVKVTCEKALVSMQDVTFLVPTKKRHIKNTIFVLFGIF